LLYLVVWFCGWRHWWSYRLSKYRYIEAEREANNIIEEATTKTNRVGKEF